MALLAALLPSACSPGGRGGGGGAEGGAAAQQLGERAAPSSAASAATPPAGGTVDSIIPIEEALRRFQAELPRTDALAGGAHSREELVESFMTALERRDTLALRSLVIDAGEFAYLYYPTSDQARPPRAQAPALAWFLIQQNSEKGITRALRRLGGQRLEVDGPDCDDEPRREGANLLWAGCTVGLRQGGAETPVPHRLFGTILERDGRFKFMSYANQF